MRSISLLLLFIGIFYIAHAEILKGSAYKGPNGQWTVKPTVDFASPSYGTYDDLISTNGWGVLKISTSAMHEDSTQAYAAGYLESYFTHARMRQFLNNFVRNEYGPTATTLAAPVAKFLQSQMDWVLSQVKLARSSPSALPDLDYWLQMGIVMDQFQGLVDGYNAYSSQKMSAVEVYALSSAGDIPELNSYFKSTNLNNHRGPNPVSPREDMFSHECSAIIKMKPDLSDIFAGHTTWRYYYAMLRMYKHVRLDLTTTPRTHARTVAFASSPGFLTSKDDFHILDSGFVVMETTNSIYNRTLFDLYLTPQSCLSWQRVAVSNRMARSGKEWTDIFAKYNSGTYNNQWMVLNVRDFVPGKAPPPNTLWILEQTPGYTQSGDVTHVLNAQGYWPSYNIPYFPQIYERSGYPAKHDQFGDQYSYADCPRARIFRRNQTELHTFEDVKAIMQYNDYSEDPLSNNDPMDAIASRADIVSGDNIVAKPFGAVDSKVTSYYRALFLEADAICGPTHQEQPAFSWAQFPNTPHEGHPEVFNFDWVRMFL